MRIHNESLRFRVTLAGKTDCALRQIDPNTGFSHRLEIRSAVACAAANVEHILTLRKLLKEFVDLKVVLKVRVWKIWIYSLSGLHITRPEKVAGSL
jgi:hypothetical protein